MNTVPAASNSVASLPPPAVQRLSGVARKAFLVTVVFSAGIFLPGLLGADMMQWGFAAAVFSGFLAMVGLITAIIYRRQARQLAAIFAGEDLLAVWALDLAQWRAAVEADWQQEKRDKRMLWYLVLGWCVVIGIGFAVYDPEAGGIVLLVLLGVAGICGVAAVLGPRWRRRRQLESEGTAWISRRGVYCGGIFHDWSMPGSSLRSVETLAEEDGRKTLELTYEFITRAGLQTETARVPVPPEQEDEALQVAEQLAATIS
jgi:hypothetical protein